MPGRPTRFPNFLLPIADAMLLWRMLVFSMDAAFSASKESNIEQEIITQEVCPPAVSLLIYLASQKKFLLAGSMNCRFHAKRSGGYRR